MGFLRPSRRCCWIRAPSVPVPKNRRWEPPMLHCILGRPPGPPLQLAYLGSGSPAMTSRPWAPTSRRPSTLVVAFCLNLRVSFGSSKVGPSTAVSLTKISPTSRTPQSLVYGIVGIAYQLSINSSPVIPPRIILVEVSNRSGPDQRRLVGGTGVYCRQHSSADIRPLPKVALGVDNHSSLNYNVLLRNTVTVMIPISCR